MDRRTGAGGTLLRLAGAIVLAGALLAALIAPWVGGPAYALGQSAGLLSGAHLELADQPPPANTVLLAADGTPLTWFYDENRQPVESAQIAPVMKQAMVAIEDARFYQHHGLDVQGTLRALVTNLMAGTVHEGGSTLTQQLVKQTLLQTATTPEERRAAVEQTVGRKLREARLALALEDKYGKDEILTRYLNIVYFGQNAYGVQPAARAFFGVDAAALTLPQAALLAGLVQSPSHDDPFDNPEGATARRNEVLHRMADQGYVSAADAAAAEAAPLGLTPAPAPRRGCAQAAVGAYVCDFVQSYLAKRGISEHDLKNNGYVVHTTLDVGLQQSGDAAVLQTLPLGDPLADMFTAVEPGTGHLLAMSVNRVFGYDVNDPTQESVNLNVVPSQGAGSTYKLFTTAAALARGFGTHYTQTTTDPYTSRVYKKDGNKPYPVQNAGRYAQTLDLETALYQSSNTYFLALEDALGSVQGPVQVAEKMGLFQFSDPALPGQIIRDDRGSFTFGAEATSPLGLASAYATVFGGGTQCNVVPVTRLLDSHGKDVPGKDGKPLVHDECTPNAIDPGIAHTITQMLRKDVEPGHPGQTARRAYVLGHQIAGKTGTSQNNYSVAFVGSTPEITASVMVLNPKRNQNVGGFGGGKGAQIWHDAMAPILEARGSGVFPPADPAVIRGNTVPVPTCTTVAGCQATLARAGFAVTTARVDSDKKAGDLVGTSPPVGGRAVPGQLIVILVSNGKNYVEPPPEPPAPPAQPPGQPPAPPPGQGPGPNPPSPG